MKNINGFGKKITILGLILILVGAGVLTHSTLSNKNIVTTTVKVNAIELDADENKIIAFADDSNNKYCLTLGEVEKGNLEDFKQAYEGKEMVVKYDTMGTVEDEDNEIVSFELKE